MKKISISQFVFSKNKFSKKKSKLSNFNIKKFFKKTLNKYLEFLVEFLIFFEISEKILALKS